MTYRLFFVLFFVFCVLTNTVSAEEKSVVRYGSFDQCWKNNKDPLFKKIFTVTLPSKEKMVIRICRDETENGLDSCFLSLRIDDIPARFLMKTTFGESNNCSDVIASPQGQFLAFEFCHNSSELVVIRTDKIHEWLRNSYQKKNHKTVIISETDFFNQREVQFAPILQDHGKPLQPTTMRLLNTQERPLGMSWSGDLLWKDDRWLMGYYGCCDESGTPFIADMVEKKFLLPSFRIQLGKFIQQENRDRLMAKLEIEGYLVHDEDDHVFVDGFFTAQEAKETAEKLHSQGVVKDFLIVKKKNDF